MLSINNAKCRLLGITSVLIGLFSRIEFHFRTMENNNEGKTIHEVLKNAS